MSLDAAEHDSGSLVTLDVGRPIWDRVFSVFPLVIIGTIGSDGRHDLAPKHMAIPIGWENYYGFVCSESHATYQNVRRSGCFTVSFPRPSDVLVASLAAAPRCHDGTKPTLSVLPVFPAGHVHGVLVRDCSLYLECALQSIQDGFGPNSLVIGRVVAARAHEAALRHVDRDEHDQIFEFPLLAYLSPGRFTEIHTSRAFPFPQGFSR
jgi:flavin reductase (DIM6/NTAB) family NADH-FMN oxidoreductase RutF